MSGGEILRAAKRQWFFFAFLLPILFFVSNAESAEIIAVADARLAPVSDVVSGIKETLPHPLRIYSPHEVKDRLREIVSREDAKIVIILGRDAMEEALRLPPSVTVIYGLVLTPPEVHRRNITGFYMATPVKEYLEIVRRYMPSLDRIAVVGSPDLIKILDDSDGSRIVIHKVKSSFELVETVKRLDSADAILLLPDVTLLTSSVLEQVYLSSFRKKIPVLGISEKNVRQGALFALVFDPFSVGRRIGEEAASAMRGVDVGQIPPSPPQKFEIFLNTETAKKMGVRVPGELIRKAKKAYP
jgi:putative ABC transport system substrate-binding protein